MMKFTIPVLTSGQSVRIQISHWLSSIIAGKQYTYEGNNYQTDTSKPLAVQECISQTIVNQEQGKCPIEYTNQISRAKIYDMKQLKVPDNVRTYNALYQE